MWIIAKTSPKWCKYDDIKCMYQRRLVFRTCRDLGKREDECMVDLEYEYEYIY